MSLFIRRISTFGNIPKRFGNLENALCFYNSSFLSQLCPLEDPFVRMDVPFRFLFLT